MVVDTSALIAILLQEEDAPTYADAIATAPGAALSACATTQGARGRTTRLWL